MPILFWKSPLLAPAGALNQPMQLLGTYKEIQTTPHISLYKQSGHLFTFLPAGAAFEIELRELIKLSQQRTVDGLSLEGLWFCVCMYVFLICVYLTFTVFSAYLAIKAQYFNFSPKCHRPRLVFYLKETNLFLNNTLGYI